MTDDEHRALGRAIAGATRRHIEAEREELERLLAEAMRLQDFDRLDLLTIIDQRGRPRTVASMWPGATWPHAPVRL